MATEDEIEAVLTLQNELRTAEAMLREGSIARPVLTGLVLAAWKAGRERQRMEHRHTPPRHPYPPAAVPTRGPWDDEDTRPIGKRPKLRRG